MKNEIEEILGSVFGKAGESGKSKAAEEAEAFLQSLSGKTGNTSRLLQQQIDELEKLNQHAQSDLEAVSQRLEEDGFAKTQAEAHPKAAGSEAEKKDVNLAFAKAQERAGSEVIGQDAFLKDMFLAFKRPIVMGTETGMPASTIVITGKTGTGRHSALGKVQKELAAQGMLETAQTALLDLALYGTSGEQKLFVQDLYAAIESHAPVILFENYEKCHKSLLPMLTELARTGKAQLGCRYALQKEMLIDVGTALVPNAISSLSCAGRYLVFLTSNSPAKMADNMGAAFLTAVRDVCTTTAFSPESLVAIGAKTLDALCAKAADRLAFQIAPCPGIESFFAGKFTFAEGVNAIEAFSRTCFSVLSEYKLSTSIGAAPCNAEITGATLSFRFPQAVVTAAETPRDTGLSEELKAQMDEIVGLKTVKDYIFSLEENFRVQQMRREKGLRSDSPSMHMLFTGNPGTGKTTIARLVSRYLKSIGLLTGGQLIEVTRADLVGRFVGHTAPLTRQVIESAIGGVLFVDEAYSLYRSGDDSFGLEAIDTLVKGMEDNRENLIVILAGYSKEMEEFLKSNSGLVSRFPNLIEFPDYTAQELFEITELTVRGKGYVLDPACREPLLVHYGKRQGENSRTAGNGRMVRNLVENAILNQSRRLIAEKSENYELLTQADLELPE